MARAALAPVYTEVPSMGIDGRTTLAGARAPLMTDGRVGDFWVDTAAKRLYGPKNAAAWPDLGLTRGAAGWYPLERIVTDGARRVVEVYDWAGGEGTKPATGYKTASGALTTTIGSAVDIRGAEGPEALIDGLDAGTDSVVYDDLAAVASPGNDNLKQPLKNLAAAGAHMPVASVAAAEALAIPVRVKSLFIVSASEAGGGDGHLRKRVNSEPDTSLKHRSADRFTADGGTDSANGGWWVVDQLAQGVAAKQRNALTPWDFRHLVAGGRVAAGQDDYPAFAALAAQYALGRSVAVPDLGNPYLISLPLTFLPPADYNFERRPPPAFEMDPSAVIRATAAMTHVLRFGSDAGDYSGYLRGPVFNLGVIDANNLADICLDLPFFVDGYFNADLRNAKKRYARFGVDTAPANSAGVKGVLQTDRDVEPWRASVTGITNGSNPTMTISQFSGEPYRAWPVGERRVVSFAALPSGWSSLANKFVDVQIVSSTSVTLLNVDSTSFGTWSGTASAYLNMPWSPPRVISGVTNANPCVITFAAPHLATSGQTYEIHDIGGMPSIDGDYVVTVLSPTTVSIPINTTSTSTWGVYSAGLGKGYAALKEDLDDMLIGLYAENCSDVDDSECFIRGTRLGASHSLSGGYDGKKNQAHVWNLIEQGELLAAYRVGGDNRLGFVQIDGPFRWCFWAVNGKNASMGCSTNYGALAPYDGYACPVRVESGATWRSFGDNWKSFSNTARLLKDASGPGKYECFGTEYSNMLLPLFQKFDFLPQAMVRFVASGGSFGTKKATFNVAAVTRNTAAGDYIISFNSPISLDAVVVATAAGNGNFSIQEEIQYPGRTVFERRFTARYLDNTLADPDEISVVWYKT